MEETTIFKAHAIPDNTNVSTEQTSSSLEMEIDNPKTEDSQEKQEKMNEDAQQQYSRLVHFLILGSKDQIYTPKPYKEVTEFDSDDTVFLSEILSSEIISLVIPTILKIDKDGISVVPHALLYALAYTINNVENNAIKHKAYKSVNIVIKTGKDFLIFNYYLRSLHSKHTGFGNGWRKAVCEWYKSKDVMELAQLTLSVPKLEKISHANLMNLAHVKFIGCDADKQIIYDYLKRDFNYVKKMYGGYPKFYPLVRFVKTVDCIKNSTYDISVARYVKRCQCGVEFLPKKFIRSPKVWFEHIFPMKTDELISKLKYLSKLGILYDCHIGDLILTRLEVLCGRENEINLNPSVVYIALMNYRSKFTMVFNNRQKRGTTYKKRCIIKKNISNVLMKLTMKTLQSLKPTQFRYIICMDGCTSLHRPCFGERMIRCREAAFMIVLSILYAAESASNVSLVTEVQNCTKQLQIDDKKETWKTLDTKLHDAFVDENEGKDIKKQFLNVSNVLQRMTASGQSYDIIIILGMKNMFCENIKENLQQYRQSINENARLIVCLLDGPPENCEDFIDKNIFLICGFDDKVWNLIQTFCTRIF